MMKRLSLISLIFAILFLIFLIGPPLLTRQLGLFPLMRAGELLDLFTPLVLIPLYWLMFRIDGDRAPGFRANIIFIIIAALWVEGQGMHLTANSISHLLKGMEGSNIYNVTYFYDEVLSHYMWHAGIFGLTAMVIFRQWRNPFQEGRVSLEFLLPAGIIHGFSLFLIVIEAQTAPLGLTFIVLVTLYGLIWGRRRFGQQPLLLFFFITCVTAILFFIIWGIMWQGLPEFSEVGII